MKMKRTFIVLAALASHIGTAAQAQVYSDSGSHAWGGRAYGCSCNDNDTQALVIRRGSPPRYEPYRGSNPAEVPGFEEPFARGFMHW